MAQQLKTKLTFVRRLIRSRRFHEALTELQSVDRSELSGSDLGEYYLVRGRAAVFGGVNEFLPDDLDNAIELFRHGPGSREFAEAKYLLGTWLATNGRHDEAKDVLLEAYASFLRCGSESQCAETLNRLSYVSFQQGNVAKTITDLERCADIYARIGDSKNEIPVRQNRCYVLYVAGRLCESLSGYSDIEPSVRGLGDRSSLIFYEMSAIPHALKGDIRTARKTIAKAKPFLDDYPREKAIYFENLGLINILDGKYPEAERALNQGLELSLKIAPESALVSQIKRLFGDLYVATQQWDKAEKYTREGLKVAEKIGERIEIAACQRIFAQIENHRGNSDMAREWFRKAIELFSVIGANYELAVTRYLAGVSGLYQNGERQAFLWMAREYFAEEEVKPYLEKVDAALAVGRAAEPSVRNISPNGAPTIIAESAAMKKVLTLARRVAPSNMTILLTGQTGTGKDLLAHYIHHYSGRQGEFVPVNTAAIPNDLAEAELFGHCKGAFTSAHSDRVGLIEQAEGGTLYLNEIADASPQFQAKLLEVIETKRVRRLGGNGSRPLSVRIIAATNHDLQQRIADGLFRLDLYHRLNEIPIELPPLSERPEDIEPLVRHFLELAGANGTGVKAEATLTEVLCGRSWPGNVREFEAVVKRLWLSSAGDITRMIELAESVAVESQREELLEVLRDADWNRREAARLLGVSEGTIRYRIRKLDLEEPHRS